MINIVLSIIFFICIGLEYLGVKFQYQNILIGISALGLGVLQLIGLLRSQQA